MTSGTNQSPEAAVQSAHSFHRLSQSSSSPAEDSFKNHPSPMTTVIVANTSEKRSFISTDESGHKPQHCSSTFGPHKLQFGKLMTITAVFFWFEFSV